MNESYTGKSYYVYYGSTGDKKESVHNGGGENYILQSSKWRGPSDI